MVETMFEYDNNDANQRSDKIYGKYMARVMENGPPDEGDHRGELLLEIPGLLEETPDGSGQQAMQVIARPSFGPSEFFVPDAEARVWVEFIAGEIDHPVWSGAWYPEEATPQTFDDQAPTEFQKVIRTTSGHVIQLDDTEDDEKIVIHHKAQSVITIDKEGNITIEHVGGAKLELKDDTTVEISGETLNFTGDNITVTGEITLDGNVQVTGDLVVGEGPSTTISGNEITGG